MATGNNTTERNAATIADEIIQQIRQETATVEQGGFIPVFVWEWLTKEALRGGADVEELQQNVQNCADELGIGDDEDEDEDEEENA